MKMKLFLTAFSFFSFILFSSAQSKEEKQVADVTEQLRKAMIDADSAALDKLTSPLLSYGHSGGHVEDKAEFINKIITGKSDFVTITLSNQTISVSGETAIVRHSLAAATNDSGKPGEVHLKILLVWQKEKKGWVLLARQAVKEAK